MVDRYFLREFFTKRAFRICPLFWLATTASIGFAAFAPLFHEPYRVLLSYSLLFSWLDPTAYFSTGAWSIGNEWAFYSLFPLLLWAWQRPSSRIAVIGASLTISLYYAFAPIDPSTSDSDQWRMYIAPLNQLILFVGGLLVGSYIVAHPSPRASLPVLMISGLLFVVISWMFDRQQCTHGFLRLIFVGFSLAWCYGSGMLRRSEAWIARSLDWIGALSYSVYLLHPLVFRLMKKILGEISALAPASIVTGELMGLWMFVLSVIGTMVVSHYSYRMLEKPAMGVGRLLARGAPPSEAANARTDSRRL